MKGEFLSLLWLVAKEPYVGRSGVMNRVRWVCLEQKSEKKVARDRRRQLGLKEYGSELCNHLEFSRSMGRFQLMMEEVCAGGWLVGYVCLMRPMSGCMQNNQLAFFLKF